MKKLLFLSLLLFVWISSVYSQIITPASNDKDWVIGTMVLFESVLEDIEGPEHASKEEITIMYPFPESQPGPNPVISRPPISRIGIGTTTPQSIFHVNGGDGIVVSHGATPVKLQFLDNNDRDAFELQHNRATDRFALKHINLDTKNERILFSVTKAGRMGVGVVDPKAKLDVDGTTRTKVLEIIGGSDLAEAFEVSDELVAEPGTILSIDPEQPGQLQVASTAYDRKVAGIVSGANGIHPGLTLKQAGSIADGEVQVALTGRVYCRADATKSAIQPGDLLTTSDLPGHAMKVTDYSRAQGAIIGKAMSSLEKGSGMVLVLVSLQ